MRGLLRRRVLKDGSVRFDTRVQPGGRRGKPVWKTFAREKAAIAHLNATATATDDGTYRRVTPTLMGDVFANWQQTLAADLVLGSLKRSTYRSYCSVLSCHLVPAFGHLRSDTLTDAAIATWRLEQAAKIAAGALAPKTFNNMIGVLKVALDWATTGVGGHALGRNPMPTKRLRAKPARQDRPIVQGAEIARLWAAASGQDRVVVALALFAGLRRGEVFGLQWGDVVWPKGRQRAALHVCRAFVQRQVVTPKSAAGDRMVELPARLVALLREHARQRPPVALDSGAAYVIRHDDGRPLDSDNWTKRVWPTIRASAKLSASVTLHALRHTFGSLHLADGAPVKHVSEQMGHANPLITMQIYQHVLRASSATATRRLDRLIPDAPAPRRQLRLVKSGAA